MSEPLPEDSTIVFKLIKWHSGIKGEYLMLETGFHHDRTIDAVRALILLNLVYADLTNHPDFKECRFYPKV
jgi:hypothetical protein